jgi:hypothetical protein
MRESKGIARLRAAERALAKARSNLAAATLEASAALGCAIESEIKRRRETRTAFSERYGISKAHVSDLIYGRRYSPAVVESLLASSAPPAGGAGAG